MILYSGRKEVNGFSCDCDVICLAYSQPASIHEYFIAVLFNAKVVSIKKNIQAKKNHLRKISIQFFDLTSDERRAERETILY